MTHDKGRHDNTEQQRHAGGDSGGGGIGGGGGGGGRGGHGRGPIGDESGGAVRAGARGSATVGAAVVPVGQGIRTRNVWKSYELGAQATAAMSSDDVVDTEAAMEATAVDGRAQPRGRSGAAEPGSSKAKAGGGKRWKAGKK